MSKGEVPKFRWVRRVTDAALIVTLCAGCSEATRKAGGQHWWNRELAPDELPQMVNSDVPFRYPPVEYAQNVQGNVLLRLFVDTSGVVVPDSTTVHESSGNTALDIAAVKGASMLRFKPARRRGTPIAVTVHFPVHFRHAAVRAVRPSPTDSTDRR